MDFIVTVLDSTTLDARNPCKIHLSSEWIFTLTNRNSFCFAVIKEWSILAIRNLCENNMENQQMIGQLTKVGDSTSDTVKEFNLEMGSMRINPNQP